MFRIRFVGGFAIAAAAEIASAQVAYQVRDLDPQFQLVGGLGHRTTSTKVTVGYGTPVGGGDGQAAWFDSAGAHLLPALAGDETAFAFDVNESLVMVGTSTDVVPSGPLIKFFDHPVRWTNGVPTDLRTLVTGGAPLELLTASGINASGQIVGYARDPAVMLVRAYRFDAGVVTDLGALPATPQMSSWPNAIADDGTVVGASDSNGALDHAVKWPPAGGIVDLHDPIQVPGRVSEAFDINRFGVIVGAADFGADFLDYVTATRWENGVVTNLGTLGGPSAPPVVESYARAINDLGVIAGTSVTSNFEVHAVVWKNGAIQDLNALIPAGTGWILTNAYDVANDGRIVGEGFINGQARPFVLIPKCKGAFTPYGSACPGGAGAASLTGIGCPAPGEPFAVEIADGPTTASGLLFLGSGQNAANVVPTCALQVLPLLPVTLPLSLDASGGAFLQTTLPPGTPQFDVTMQALFADPSVPSGISGTPPLKLHFE